MVNILIIYDIIFKPSCAACVYFSIVFSMLFYDPTNEIDNVHPYSHDTNLICFPLPNIKLTNLINYDQLTS